MTPRPSIFVVGDAKCGTTTLYRMLQLGQGVGTSRTRKELHYFSAPELVQKAAGPGDDRIPNDIVHDEAAYLAEFAHLPSGLADIADVSPSYLQEPAAAARIRAFAPDARIVILLREPAAKIMSQYTHLWSEGRETLPFADAFAASEARRAAGWSTMFDYEAGGRYAAAVERYLALFGRERVMVALFEELVADDPALRRRLEAFLGIRFAEGPPPRMNVGGRIEVAADGGADRQPRLARRAEAAPAARPAHPGRPGGARRGPGREAGARSRHRRVPARPLRRRRRPPRDAHRPQDRLAGGLIRGRPDRFPAHTHSICVPYGFHIGRILATL